MSIVPLKNYVQTPLLVGSILIGFIGCKGTSSGIDDSPNIDDSTAPAGYELVWSDEFDTEGLPNNTNWHYDTEANASGWYNNELQYYGVERLKNSEVGNGQLTITAYKESLTLSNEYTNNSAPDYGGQDYTSARLITRGKASWTYGFFEIRAKMPCGLGTWPAIWMLGTQGDWPEAGEIDIMEHVGQEPNTIHGTLHNQSTANTFGNGGSVNVPDACTQFHNYQLTWTHESIKIGIDKEVYFTYVNPKTDTDAWPYDQPQYMLLNLAIGGDMAGPVDDSIFPAKFEVEYVRVYQIPSK